MKIAAAGGVQTRNGQHDLECVGDALVDEVRGRLEEDHRLAEASEAGAGSGKRAHLSRPRWSREDVDRHEKPLCKRDR